jgi:colicin import membrane protein
MQPDASLLKALCVSVLAHALLLGLVLLFQLMPVTHTVTPVGIKAMSAYLATNPSQTPPATVATEPVPAATPPVVAQLPERPKESLKEPVPVTKSVTKAPALTPPQSHPDDLLVRAHKPDNAQAKPRAPEPLKDSPKKLTPEQRARELKQLADEASKLNAVSQAIAQDTAAKQAAQRARAERDATVTASLSREEAREQSVAAGALGRYAALLQARFEHNWVRPAAAQKGLRCEVKVTQVPGGTVTGVKIGSCNGDASVQQSIIDAVYRSSPLPPPEDMNVFERQFTVIFAPDH